MTKTMAAAAALGGMVAAGALSAAQAEVRIGFLTDMEAAYSDIAGQGALIAAQMAVEDFGGEVLGERVELIAEDTRLDGDYALEVGRRMHEEQGVVAFAEMVGTQVALPLQEYAREQGLPALHVGAASSILTGRNCSPTGVDWVYDTYALAGSVVPTLVERGHESWYFITVDYTFGEVLQNDAESMLRASGGEVVGSSIHPFQTDDLFDELEAARASGADVIAFANAGADLRTGIRQAYELGILGGDEQQVVSLLTTINDVRSVGLYAARDLLYVTSFYWDMDARTREWSERFRARHGTMPTMLQAGSYSVIYNYLEAVERAGTVEGDAVVEAMRAQPVDDFFARDAQLRADGRLAKEMYLVQVRSPREMDQRSAYLDVVETIPPEVATRPLEQSDCPHLQ